MMTTCGFSGCIFLKLRTKVARVVMKIEKLLIATACLLPKPNMPMRMGTEMPPPPMPAMLLRAFTAANTK